MFRRSLFSFLLTFRQASSHKPATDHFLPFHMNRQGLMNRCQNKLREILFSVLAQIFHKYSYTFLIIVQERASLLKNSPARIRPTYCLQIDFCAGTQRPIKQHKNDKPTAPGDQEPEGKGNLRCNNRPVTDFLFFGADILGNQSQNNRNIVA